MRVPHLFSHLMPGKLVIAIQLLLVVEVMSRERRCPIYMDGVWKQKDQQCDEGKKYHCFEDQLGLLVSDGCYIEKQCRKGAHPVVEGNHIRCVYCQSGYQPIEPLYSSKFTFSYCQRHSRPCNPEFGESLCQEPTKEMDRACTCNASLGFFPKFEGENCTCFTLNDVCSGCSFRSCPKGSLKNDRGFCEPIRSMLSTTSRTTNLVTTMQVPPDKDEEDWKIPVAICSVILGLAVIAVIILCCCRKKIREYCNNKDKHKVHFGLDTEDKKKLTDNKNGLSSEDGNDRTAKGRSGDIEKQLIVQNGDVYLDVQTMHMVMGDHSTVNVEKLIHPTISNEPVNGQVKPETASAAQPSDASEPKDDPRNVSPDPEQSTTDPVKPYASLPDPSTPPPSMPEPSTPPPSMSDPSAPPPSMPEPSAPPPSMPEPSAPPPSMPDPTAPPPSMPEPSAPLPSMPVMDNSPPNQEEKQPRDDDEETLRKVPLSFQCGETEDKGKKVASPAERQPCDDDEETLRKVPLSFQCSKTEDKGKKVASPAEGHPCDNDEETLRKVPLSFQSGETEEEGKKVTSPGKPWQPVDNGETSYKVPVSLQDDEVEIKTPLLSDSVTVHRADILFKTTEPEKVALLCAPSTNDEETDLPLNIRT